MTRALIIATTLALAGCATVPTGYPKARGSVERIEEAYLVVRGPAEKAIARLPEPARSRAGAALILADATLAVVRSRCDLARPRSSGAPAGRRRSDRCRINPDALSRSNRLAAASVIASTTAKSFL